MRAVLRLAWLPVVVSPVATAAIVVLCVVLFALPVILHSSHGVSTVLISSMPVLFLAWFLIGQALKLIARSETLLLPNFRRTLGVAGMLWALTLWLLPAAYASVQFGWQAGWWIIGAGALGIVYALYASSGSRGTGYVVVALVALINLMPAPMRTEFGESIAHSFWPPALLLALAALGLRHYARGLFTRADPATPDAPFAPPAPIQGPQRNAGSLPAGRRLRALYEWGAAGNEARLRRHAQRYRRKPTPGLQRKLLSILLFPYEQPRGWVVKQVSLLFPYGMMLVGTHAMHPSVEAMNVYGVILALANLGIVGMGMLRLRTSLVDLYFNLAPASRTDFNALLADSFLTLLPGAVASAYVLTAVGALVIEPHALPRALLVTTLCVPPSALAVLALFMIQPANLILRLLVLVLALGGGALAYRGTYGLLHIFGTPIGSLVALAVGWTVAIAAWQASRQLFIERPLNFEPPRA